ncbi:acetyl-CoA carboxylase biotin carboxylase subunit family protein [Streptomyces sp. NPDC093094]|uniref:ATP-grasp domain-containing protein n=1 Tax=Streptomyces sp. NPDC093094 TaxID=3366026 RepID=UPI0038309FB0
MPKPLLLLGVGGPAAYAEFTVAQIAAAHPVVLADMNVPNWVRPYLAQHLTVDLTDQPAALETLRRFAAHDEVGGVLAMERQHLATAAQFVRSRLPRASGAHALAACSSPAAVRRLLGPDVLQPRWAVAHDAESAALHADAIGYPVDLRWSGRPDGAVGPAHSRSDVMDLCARFRQAVPGGDPHPDTVLVEEHLSGPRIWAEAVVLEDGETRLVAVTRTTVGPAPARQAIRHGVYAHDELLHNRQLRQTVDRTAHALGIAPGVLHIEMACTSRGPCVMDVGAHPAGDLIPLLVKRATGISLPQVAADLANGEPPALAPTRQKAAAVHFAYPATRGRVGELAFGDPGPHAKVERSVLTQHLDNRVNPLELAGREDRLAHWVALGDNASDCAATLDRSAGTLVVALAPVASTVHAGGGADQVPQDLTPGVPGGAASFRPDTVGADDATAATGAALPGRPARQSSPRFRAEDADPARPHPSHGFTADDIHAFEGLMAELVSTCASIGSTYCADEKRQSLAPGLDSRLSEASEVLADLSRTLNRTRSGIRKIHAQAHRRALLAGRPGPGPLPSLSALTEDSRSQ